MPLHVSGNHWVLAIAYLGQEEVDIHIYDSLHTPAHYDEACAIVTKSGIFKKAHVFTSMNENVQSNNFDCGIMVIANAVELLGGARVPSIVDDKWGIDRRAFYAVLCTDSAKLHALKSLAVK